MEENMDFATAWIACTAVTMAVSLTALFKTKPVWVQRVLDSGPRSDIAVAYGIVIPVMTACALASVPLAGILDVIT